MRLFSISVLLVLGFPFIMSDVVDSFGQCSTFFLNGEPPMIKGILEKSVSQNNNRYKIICQEYNSKKRFATLYDTKNKIPVFSAYTYTGRGKVSRPQTPWMIEPKLESTAAHMREPCVNQACTENYWNKQDLNRGHLFPQLHAADKDTATSTFTLTNVVPQKIGFNSGSWNHMEQKVKQLMDSYCRDEKDNNKILAYVLTGAIPSQTELLNEKVNIPSHMWTAFCCYNSKSKKWESQAHWAENIDESKDEGKTISGQSLKTVQDFLNSKYKGKYTLFNDACLNFLKAENEHIEADSDDQQNDEIESYWSYFTQLPATFWAWLCNK